MPFIQTHLFVYDALDYSVISVGSWHKDSNGVFTVFFPKEKKRYRPHSNGTSLYAEDVLKIKELLGISVARDIRTHRIYN